MEIIHPRMKTGLGKYSCISLLNLHMQLSVIVRKLLCLYETGTIILS
jgi:hypothetical protein